MINLTNVLNKAYSFLGVPYVYGGNGYEGIDCSGLIQQSYKAGGVNIPRTAQDQYNQSTKIEADQLQPGDLIFEGSSTNNITHVLMYVGNGMAVESPRTGLSVRTTALSTRSNIVGYGSYTKGNTITLNNTSDAPDLDAGVAIGGGSWIDGIMGGFFGSPGAGTVIGGVTDSIGEFLSDIFSNIVRIIVIIGIVILAFYLIFKAFN